MQRNLGQCVFEIRAIAKYLSVHCMRRLVFENHKRNDTGEDHKQPFQSASLAEFTRSVVFEMWELGLADKAETQLQNTTRDII